MKYSFLHSKFNTISLFASKSKTVVNSKIVAKSKISGNFSKKYDSPYLRPPAEVSDVRSSMLQLNESLLQNTTISPTLSSQHVDTTRFVADKERKRGGVNEHLL